MVDVEKVNKRKDIHPKLNKVYCTFTNGEKVEFLSTSSDDVVLDIDPLNHPAWTKSLNVTNSLAKNVAKFNKKFGDFLDDL